MKNSTVHFFVGLYFIIFFVRIGSAKICGLYSDEESLWQFGIQGFWLITYVVSSLIVGKIMKKREAKENGAI